MRINSNSDEEGDDLERNSIESVITSVEKGTKASLAKVQNKCGPRHSYKHV
jgi:hypothetical protein